MGDTTKAITVPRSFAALAKAASDYKHATPYLRTVLVEALRGGRVRGSATEGRLLMSIEAEAPEVNLDLFAAPVAAARVGTRVSCGADDLATLAKSVRAPKGDTPPPPLEILVGAETVLRCGSEVRRVQIESGGPSEARDWPAGWVAPIPDGQVLAGQVYSVELLRTLLGAVAAAGVTGVKVEVREGLAPLVMRGVGQDGEVVTGLLCQIRMAGEAEGEAEAERPSDGDGYTTTLSCPQTGQSVTLTDKEFARVARRSTRERAAALGAINLVDPVTGARTPIGMDGEPVGVEG